MAVKTPFTTFYWWPIPTLLCMGWANCLIDLKLKQLVGADMIIVDDISASMAGICRSIGCDTVVLVNKGLRIEAKQGSCANSVLGRYPILLELCTITRTISETNIKDTSVAIMSINTSSVLWRLYSAHAEVIARFIKLIRETIPAGIGPVVIDEGSMTPRVRSLRPPVPDLEQLGLYSQSSSFENSGVR